MPAGMVVMGKWWLVQDYLIAELNFKLIGEIAGVWFVSPIVFQYDVGPDALIVFEKTGM